MSIRRFIQNLVSIFACLLCVFAAQQPFKALLAGDYALTGIFVYWAMVAFLFLFRKPSQDESTQLGHWVVAITASVLPFLLHAAHNPFPWLYWAGVGIQVITTLFVLLTLSQLGRSFGVVAARREVKTHGMYRLIRHPLYATEMLALLAVVMQQPDVRNALVWALVMALQFLRIAEEERILRRDPAYEAYCQTVPFRLIPGVY